MTREEYARKYLEHIEVSSLGAIIIIALFLLFIFAVPVYQICCEASKGKVKEAEIIDLLPNKARISRVHSVWDIGNLFGSSEEIKKYETSVEDTQYLSKAVRPYVQTFLTGILKTGNEKALTGKNSELFYSEELKALTQPDLENAKKAADEIIALKRYIKSRGAEFIVLPVPCKMSVYPELFCNEEYVKDTALEVLEKCLADEGVLVCSLSDTFKQNKSSKLFLSCDTHWTGTGLYLAAEKLAFTLTDFKPSHLTEIRQSNIGDIFDMLQLPENQNIFQKENVLLKKSLNTYKEKSILLLGDSYSNIYSDPSLKWGEGAGLAETISALTGTGTEKIAVNAGGASSSRRELFRKLAEAAKKGEPDILSDKKCVIYEFAEREISLGEWESFDWEKINKIRRNEND